MTLSFQQRYLRLFQCDLEVFPYLGLYWNLVGEIVTVVSDGVSLIESIVGDVTAIIGTVVDDLVGRDIPAPTSAPLKRREARGHVGPRRQEPFHH
ncbi:hypothetical protein MNV49_006050 [Pseudohyphozyma bogoriensis]|nr:hypothetical protein MNV49_006050 [Pseudohyphozyma bogoriensis]